MQRTTGLFGRQREWDALTEFVDSSGSRVGLAIVTGLEHSSSQNLVRLSQQYTEFVHSPSPIRWARR